MSPGLLWRNAFDGLADLWQLNMTRVDVRRRVESVERAIVPVLHIVHEDLLRLNVRELKVKVGVQSFPGLAQSFNRALGLNHLHHIGVGVEGLRLLSWQARAARGNTERLRLLLG